MFLSENVVALFKKGVLKLEKNDDGEYRRVAEATCVIEPFPHTLARELGEEIAGHLFDDDHAIRQELESIDLRMRVGLQNVTVRPDEALEPIALITPATIKDVNATVVEDKKSGRRWLSFSFVLVFSLEKKAARNFVLDQFGRTLLWTFERMQGDLLATARIKEAGARMADVCGDGIESVTLSTEERSVTLTAEDGQRLRQEAKDLRRKAAH